MEGTGVTGRCIMCFRVSRNLFRLKNKTSTKRTTSKETSLLSTGFSLDLGQRGMDMSLS